MTLIEQFKEFEQNESLFKISVDGLCIWELVRYETFQEIQQQTGTGRAHSTINPNSKKNQLKGIKLWIKNLFYRNPLLTNESDIIFLGHPRRKKEQDGYWWDIYCDPIHETCKLDSIHFERTYLLEHKSPAKTEPLRYLDLLDYGGTILRKIGFSNSKLNSKESKELFNIENKINSEFGVNIDLTKKIHNKLSDRCSRRWLYEILLEKINPEIVVVVVSYDKEIFIEACKRLRIPVVELQHGVIHSDHIGYSFDNTRKKELFPDYLLTWGEFWNEGIEFPIPSERVIPVGYPYLQQAKQRYENIGSKNQILFISQGTIGAELSQFALQVAQHPDMDYDIVYKLHPGEYDRWKDEYPWLVDSEFEIIDDSDTPLYQLFAESSVQIGVYSTAIYEGLMFNLETYIYNCSGSEILRPLIEQGVAQLISSANELESVIGKKDQIFNPDYYFSPNATEQICEVLQQLVNSSSTFSNQKHKC